MVSQEEYEYSAFKCAFCKALNPAKKLRPIAPRLPLPSKAPEEAISNKPIESQIQSATTNVSDKDSGNVRTITRQRTIIVIFYWIFILGSETEPISNVIESKNSNETKPSIESDDTEIEQSTVQDQQSVEPSSHPTPHPPPQSTVDSEAIVKPVEKSDSDKKNE